jgi:abortive infection bacteriophage resistance protein
MIYAKPFLSYDDQAELLLSRGLSAEKEALVVRLKTVNYYRLSGYLYPFRKSDDSFKAGTRLDTVWRHYTFDRRFRLLVLDAIERVEVTVRSRLAYLHARDHGPFGYLEASKLPGLRVYEYDHWKGDLAKEIGKSSERYIRHFRDKYGDFHELPPIWITVEQMTMGKTVTFYRGCEAAIQKDIAAWFGVPDNVLFSWLRTLNEVRNVCAHHGRLWNRELGNNFLLPNQRKYPEWYSPYRVPQNRMFGVLTVLNYLIKTSAPASHWRDRLHTFFSEYDDIPLAWMGFPAAWEEGPLWK